MEKIQEHKLNPASGKRRTIIAPVINMDIPRAFFNGGSQGEPPLGGVGAVIQLSTKTKLCIKYALGQATNNKDELTTLWAVLKMDKSKKIQNIHIYGD